MGKQVHMKELVETAERMMEVSVDYGLRGLRYTAIWSRSKEST